MRCVDAIEELAASSGLASAALTDHLARCPRCAAWARRDARLTRLWEATRPREPGPAAWETVWAKVTQAVEAEHVAPHVLAASSSWPRLMTAAAPAGRWRRGAWAAFGIAQAAAL